MGLLDEFEKLRYEVHGKLIDTIKELSDEEIKELRLDCSKQTTTNCSWAMYDMSKDASALASIEASSREKQKLK